METHYIPAFTNPGAFKQAACGAMVRLETHSAEPSCGDCLAWLQDDAADAAKYPTVEARAADLFGTEPGERVQLNTFDVYEHYRERKGLR